MNPYFVRPGEKKKLLRVLEEQFGISKLNYLLVETGKQKIRGFSGDMTKEEIRELVEIANVEIIGAYLIKKDEMFGLRLSLDGVKILEEKISKNIVEINDEQLIEWMNGKNFQIEMERGNYVIKQGNDFFGCGFCDGKKMINFVPKERRIRKS